MCRTKAAVAAMLLSLVVASPSSADAIFNVSINTSAIAGTQGKVAFDYLVNDPPSGHHLEILNIVTNSKTAALPETEGGLVEGNVILPPYTTPGAPLSGFPGFAEIGGGSFFNELILNLTFGTSLAFEVHVPEYLISGIPDQFSLFLLNSAYLPMFPTSDPTGANALFVVDILGPDSVSALAFGPATLNGNAVNIVVPGGSVPEPSILLLIGAGMAGASVRSRSRRSKASGASQWRG